MGCKSTKRHSRHAQGSSHRMFELPIRIAQRDVASPCDLLVSNDVQLTSPAALVRFYSLIERLSVACSVLRRVETVGSAVQIARVYQFSNF
jgi:hypothetical protein